MQNKLLVFVSAAMIIVGLVLVVWAVANLPASLRGAPAQAVAPTVTTTDLRQEAALPENQAGGEAAPTPGVTAAVPTLLSADLGDAPAQLAAVLEVAATGVSRPLTVAVASGADQAAMRFDVEGSVGQAVYTVTFAAATRFDTIDPQGSEALVRGSWAGSVPTYTQVAVLSDTLPALVHLLGRPGAGVQGYASMEEVVAATWQDRATLALVPFDQLDPRLLVLSIDGQNPVENANHFDAAAYPLAIPIYAEVTAEDPAQAALARALLAQVPAGNRLPDKLTVLAMTGVTAMCRQTAEQMDRLGPAWPAEVVGPELASADITHISNEVPFVEGCQTNTSPDNFNFCSKPEYMETLTASGVDIIGLTGNHQNDFGRENALKSLDIYAEAGLPLYGGGRNKVEAFAPLLLEHNGNRLAFLGANSYGPKFAWATDNLPGAAEFDLAIMSATIRSIKEKDLADVVLAELQYQESYDVQPLADQRQDFNALVRAGADIVTGVQSHVPQGMEFSDDGMILYGLGNLYFDQMWDQATREGLIVKHTIYQGRHISTQVLTTLLYDYGQPRWTTAAQRESLLERVFGASYW